MRTKTKTIGVLCLLTSLAAISNEQVELRADRWCPHNCTPDSQQEGYLIELARYSFKRAGIDVHYELSSWSRAILSAQQGENIGLVGAALTKATQHEYIFPDIEQGRSVHCFYTLLKNNWNFASVESLNQQRFGVTEGYHFNSSIDHYISSMKRTSMVQTIADETAAATNLKKLFINRIDVVLDDNMVIQYEAALQDRQNDIREAGCVHFSEGNNYIVFHKSNPHAKRYAKILTEGTIASRQSGYLSILLKKYQLKDWREKP